MKQIFLLTILFVVAVAQNTSQIMDAMTNATNPDTDGDAVVDASTVEDGAVVIEADDGAALPPLLAEGKEDGTGDGAVVDASTVEDGAVVIEAVNDAALPPLFAEGEEDGDNADAFPNDPDKSEEESSTSGVGIIILVIFGCGFIYLAIYYMGWRRKRSNDYASLADSVHSEQYGELSGEFVQSSVIF